MLLCDINTWNLTLITNFACINVFYFGSDAWFDCRYWFSELTYLKIKRLQTLSKCVYYRFIFTALLTPTLNFGLTASAAWFWYV